MEVAFLGYEQAIAGLVQFLSGTPQYHEVARALDELRRKPQLFKRLVDFKAAASAGQLSQQQMESLGHEYQQMTQVPELMRYFQASDEYAEVIGNVMNDINARLEKSVGL